MSIVYPPKDTGGNYGTASYGVELRDLKYCCPEQATVVGVNYEANTIDIELVSDSTSFTGVKYLCHTDIDYYSYLTNGLEIPDAPTEVFSHTSHCFMKIDGDNTVIAMVVRLPAELGGDVSCTVAIPYRTDTIDPCKGETYWAYYFFYAHLYVRTGVFETKIIIYDRFRNKLADIVNNAGTGLVTFPCDYSDLSSWMARPDTEKVSETAMTSYEVDLVQYGQPPSTDPASELWWETTYNDSDSDLNIVCDPVSCANPCWVTETTVSWSERTRTPKAGTYSPDGVTYYTKDTYGSYRQRYDAIYIKKGWANVYGIISDYEVWDGRTYTWSTTMGCCPHTPALDYNYVAYSFLGIEMASLRTKQNIERSVVWGDHYNQDWLGSIHDGTRSETDTSIYTLTYESNVVDHNFSYTDTSVANWTYGPSGLDSYSLVQDSSSITEQVAAGWFKGAITTDGDSAVLFLSYAVAFLHFPIYRTHTHTVSDYYGVISQDIDYNFYVDFVLYDAFDYTLAPKVDLPPLMSNGPAELTNLMQDLLEGRFEGDDGTIGASYFDSPEIWIAKFDNRIRSF